MEKAVSTLTNIRLSKTGIQNYVSQISEEIKSGYVNPLEAKIFLKSWEKIITGVSEEIESYVMSEVDKYSEKSITVRDCVVEKSELGTKYNFENCGDVIWEKLNADFLEVSEKKKEREDFLRKIKEQISFLDEETGETWKVNPAIKKSTSGIKIFFK